MYELLLSSTRATYRALLHFITSLYLPHFKRTTTAQIVPINDIHILTVITFASNFQFLSAFAKLRKATITFVMFVRSSFRPSVRMEQSGLPLDGFSWNFVFKYFSKICPENSSFIKIWQKQRILYMKTNIHFLSYLVYFLLDWKMFQTKVVEETKTCILSSIMF